MSTRFERLIARTPSGTTEFFDTGENPWIADVEARAGEIRQELDGLLARVDQLPNFQDVQEEQRELTQDDRWKVFLFYAYGARFDRNCALCPRTTEIVESIPGMTTAMFSVLLPHKHIPPHTGPWKGVLRYHLALRTPADETAARIRVGSRTEHWRDGRSLLFDDTFEHEAWNDSDEIRVVLFVDVIRDLPWYLAVPNRAFIGAIRRSRFIKRALANNEAWQESLGATIDPPSPL
jgi:beta-hydroxylase